MFPLGLMLFVLLKQVLQEIERYETSEHTDIGIQ